MRYDRAMQRLILAIGLVAACGKSSGQQPPPANVTPVAEPTPAPPPDAGEAIPPGCEDYARAIRVLASCEQLPVETRKALLDSYEEVKAAWATVPREDWAHLGEACKSASDAVAQAADSCPK